MITLYVQPPPNSPARHAAACKPASTGRDGGTSDPWLNPAPRLRRKLNPGRWERLLSEERHALLPPSAFLDQIGIEPGSVVADLGAGAGFFTEPLAPRVGPEGRVYAVDIAPEMIHRLHERDLPAQVEVRLSGENRLPIPDEEVDLALLAFVLHEMETPDAFLKEVRRVLRPGGRLVVLEWLRRIEEMGPPLEERLAEEESARILTESDFRIAERGHPNASNYYLIATPDRATEGNRGDGTGA
jgi:ubiquinone/menaquinone biosynthesis C-methylase UbiE